MAEAALPDSSGRVDVSEREPVEEPEPVPDGDVQEPEPIPASCAVRLHMACPSFAGCAVTAVQRWVRQSTEVRVTEVFKHTKWPRVFVTVKGEEDAVRFEKDMQGALWRETAVTMDRDTKTRTEGEGRPPKRRKLADDFEDGCPPSLKDLIIMAKKEGGPQTVVQKTAPLMRWSYDIQLQMKNSYVKTAVRTFTKNVRSRTTNDDLSEPFWTKTEYMKQSKFPFSCGCHMDPPIGTSAENQKGYRNKCEFTISRNRDGAVECGFVLGIQSDGSEIVDSVVDCSIVPGAMKDLCAVMKTLVEASPFALFDRRRGHRTGVWRNVMARLSPTGEMLVLVQVASLSEEEQRQFTKSLVDGLAEHLNIVSIYLQINDTPTDAARPDAPLFHVHGSPALAMPLLGLTFQVGPGSFFQTNSATCVELYSKALEWLRPAGSVVLDVCCGVGTIGLCAAKHCKRVIGLELVPEAVESAIKNAELNGIRNASFYAGRAEDSLPRILQELGDEEVCAVVDPPRAGLHKTVLEALRGFTRLRRLVYVSCNPDSLVEDVVRLCVPRQEQDMDAFVPVRAVAVDMFPHTLHCEMVLLLERAGDVQPQQQGNDASEPVESTVQQDG
uniref:Uncharacterized protein n=1 Tax=Noctiluca scintillans TaxID=2966 RepID=A0A7S1F1U1_NOCSC